jgi:hypothetical protein
LADIGSDATQDAAATPRAWQERAVSRSFERFRAHAERQSARFIETALELVEKTEGQDFTVQDVVDRMKVSTRTFYQFFSGKDEFHHADDVCRDAGKHPRLAADGSAAVSGGSVGVLPARH